MNTWVMKEDLTCWVFILLKRALPFDNIAAGFKVSDIWPLDNLKMDKKMFPSKYCRVGGATKLNVEPSKIVIEELFSQEYD